MTKGIIERYNGSNGISWFVDFWESIKLRSSRVGYPTGIEKGFIDFLFFK